MYNVTWKWHNTFLVQHAWQSYKSLAKMSAEWFCFVIIFFVLFNAAQDLLDSWLHEKKSDDFNLEVQFKAEKWAQRSTPLEEDTEDRYGDHLLQSHNWSSVNSYDNSPPLNIMGKTWSFIAHSQCLCGVQLRHLNLTVFCLSLIVLCRCAISLEEKLFSTWSLSHSLYWDE